MTVIVKNERRDAFRGRCNEIYYKQYKIEVGINGRIYDGWAEISPILDRVFVKELHNEDGDEVNISYEAKKAIEAILPKALAELHSTRETI